MFAALRRRVTYTNVGVTLALVFAMSGGAFALGGHGGAVPSRATASAARVTAVQAKAKSKTKAGARGPAGPRGATGATGPAGATGATGPAGATGPVGAQGVAGTDGSDGEAGKEGAPGKNGRAGPEGPQGSPWTAGGTLPAEKTETGSWAVASGKENGVYLSEHFAVPAPISFPIPLQQPLEGSAVHFVKYEESGGSACPGSVEKPEAAPGDLCVYESFSKGIEEFDIFNMTLHHTPFGTGAPGASADGAAVLPVKSGEESIEAFGAWAVTAPAEA
jgi:hypothetical protein